MSKQSEFIEVLVPLAQAEYTERNTILPSVCVAQAALESGWNLQAKTMFGIKGNGKTLMTKEYINGKYEVVTASFRSYPNLAASVDGYYDFMQNNRRYSYAISLKEPYSQIQAIARAGYATAPNYASVVSSIIRTYNLQKYDVKLTKSEDVSKQDGVSYATDFDKSIAGTYVVNSHNGINVRKGAGTKFAKLFAIPNGTKIQCYGYHTGDWYYVAVNGKVGFVYSRYIRRE